MKKLTTILFHLSLLLFTFVLSAAIPQHWTVETSRVQPAQFEAFHGETIEFAATMQSYGKPLAITNDLIGIYWQTNGMGSAYWTAPAVLSNNVMIARWTPSMDVGANVYSCFIGAPGEIYRAAFQLRLRPSPGAVPSELPLPVKTLDFAQVQVLNAPYYSKSETDAALSDKQDTISDLASIRSGAALGATAVQPSAISDMETKTHAAATFATKTALATLSDTVDSKLGKSGGVMTGPLAIVGSDVGEVLIIDGMYLRVTNNLYNAYFTLPAYKEGGVIATTDEIPSDGTIRDWGYIKTERDPTVDGKINTHNSSSSAHDDIRQSVSAKYSKPSSGIPKTDLASAVQTSLGKADSAVQSAAIIDMETRTHAGDTYQPKGNYLTTETDPTVAAKIDNTVTTAFIRERLGVYLYVGEDGGIYVHTGD